MADDPDASQADRERYPADDYWLPAALVKNRDAYRVKPGLQIVDDVPCHVLEREGLDRLWVQSEPTVLLRRRQFQWVRGGPVRQIGTFRDHREVAKGVWLPGELEFDRYGAPWEEADLKENVVYRIRLKASRIVAQPFADSDFRAQIPKGAVVQTEENRQFVNQPGKDPYEEARKLLPARSRWKVFLALSTLAIILVVLCWRVLVNRQRSEKSLGEPK